MRSLSLAACAAFALAACVDESPPGGGTSAPEAAAPAGGPAPSATAGGDGSELALTGLLESDIGDRLRGELRCAFTAGDGALLMLASANVGAGEPIFAIVKNGGYVETLHGASAGGYDAMVDGTSYAGPGLVIGIAHGGDDSQDGEGLSFTATLRADRADGAARSWDGTWSCGP